MGIREFRTELPSTQTEAIRRARAGAPHGGTVVARRRTSGRGRLDHAWSSPEGGLYLSVVVRAPTENAALLPLAAGARIGRALADRYRIHPVLKWPNDLLILEGRRTRKLAGILTDEVDSPTLGRAAVVGVGLNVSTPVAAFPPALAPRVVTLAELMPVPPSLDALEEVVVEAIVSAAEALASASHVPAILEECRAALHGVGCRATVDGTLTGVIRALGDEGELWLTTREGPVAVRAGDLVVEEA